MVTKGPKGWQILDHRELPGGGWIVYHWPAEYVERFCASSYRPMHPDADRCRDHIGAPRPCEVWHRQPPECMHEQLVPNRPHPRCAECGLVGEDVTAEMGA
jgi:hypothetical protein